MKRLLLIIMKVVIFVSIGVGSFLATTVSGRAGIIIILGGLCGAIYCGMYEKYIKRYRDELWEHYCDVRDGLRLTNEVNNWHNDVDRTATDMSDIKFKLETLEIKGDKALEKFQKESTR